MCSALLAYRWPFRRGGLVRSWFLLQPPAGVWKLTMVSAMARASALAYQAASLSSGMWPLPASGGDGGASPGASSAARVARSFCIWVCERLM
jgi:hypothetical protein